MIVVVYAHPYPDRSRAGRALLEAVQGLPDVEVRSLYELYPDFGIDVEAEQEALTRADTIVWQHPLYWYSVPGLLKHWFDKVLAGWAYGEGGTALVGKRCCGSPPPAAMWPRSLRPACTSIHSRRSWRPSSRRRAAACGSSPSRSTARTASPPTMHELAASYRQRLTGLSRSEEASVATA